MMYNGDKIIPGLIIAVALLTFPFWYNMGVAAPAPELQLPKDQTECVASKDFMRSSHMQILNDWRNEVVRNGDRIYIAANGKMHYISLQNTCMECHTSKVEFCDKCHNYVGATPYCWTCHVEPKEAENAKH